MFGVECHIGGGENIDCALNIVAVLYRNGVLARVGLRNFRVEILGNVDNVFGVEAANGVVAEGTAEGEMISACGVAVYGIVVRAAEDGVVGAVDSDEVRACARVD